MRIKNNQKAFLELVKAGLWGDGNPEIRIDGTTDWDAVYRLATEQSVLGLVLAGLEHSDVKPPKELMLHWIGEVQIIEQRNKAMNQFIADLVSKMRDADIYTLLVKGQGIAQCYENPLWRTSGDVDLLLSEDNYIKAKDFLIPLASGIDKENKEVKHLAMLIDGWSVELHGSLRSCSLSKMDKLIDDVQNDVFFCGNVRSWKNSNTLVFLPSADNDVIFVFTHILKHLFHGGIGLRQICDWCRLIFSYKDFLNHGLLEQRVRKAGLMSEWKTFAALAVDYLGMQEDIMPLYSSNSRWSKKAKRVMRFVLKTGNFGHNRDLSFYQTKSFLQRKAISFGRQTSDGLHHLFIFPLDSLKVWGRMIGRGLWAMITKRD